MLKLLAGLLLFLLGEAALASPLTPATLQVDIRLDAKKSSAAGIGRDAASTLCATLAPALKIQGGPYGFGIFADVDCSMSNSSNSTRSLWRLNIAESDTALDIEVVRRKVWSDPSSGSVTEAKFQILTPHSLADLVRHPDIVELLALAILDSLPFLAFVERGSNLQKIDERPREWRLPPVSKTLWGLAAEVPTRSGVWKVRVVGRATVKGAAPSAQHSYAVGWSFAATPAPFWVQNAEGRGQMAEQALQILQEAMNGFDRTKLAALPQLGAADAYHSFLSLRLGIPMSFGIVSEIRSSWLSGLRLQYDVMPTRNESVEDLKIVLNTARGFLGWSFGYEISALASRVDIAPLLEVWSVHTELPGLLDRLGRPTESHLEISTQLLPAIELGVERVLFGQPLRLWYAQNFGKPLMAGEVDLRLHSARGGVSAYLAGHAFRACCKLGLQAFSSAEKVTVTRSGTALSEADVREFSFLYVYLGVGAGILW